jgi:hypothetical protein
VTNSEIFRSKSSAIAAAIAYSVISIMIFQTIFTGEIRQAFLTIGLGSLVALFFYLILHRPLLEIADDGIKIVNPLWSYNIGWRDISAIETRYTMSVQARGEVIYAWAAPAPGRYHARKIHPSEVRGMDIASQSTVRFGESPRSDSGVAAYLARSRWKKFPEGNREFSKVFNTSAIILAAIAVAISVVGLLIH